MKIVPLFAVLLALAGSGLAVAATAAAETPAPYAGPVAVVVSIPIPAGLSRAMIQAQFEKLAPAYEALPGLKQKYFTVNDTRAGGIYLWIDRAAAQAYYNDAWRTGVQKTYGAAAEVTFFDAPVIIQGKAGMKTKGKRRDGPNPSA